MKIFLLSLMFFVCIISYSQIITIKDSKTQLPLEKATLISENPKAFSITNKNGQAKVSDFKESNNIEVRIVGYKTEFYSYSDIEKLNFVIQLEESSFSVSQVVVSSNKWNQISNDVPFKITKIPMLESTLNNSQTTADLLGSSGEVFIQKSQQGGGSPMIRGFATNRLLYTIDGIRMNTAIFRSGNIQNIISLDAFAIENTEILYGPSSVIYGSDAIGGTMSFTTLTPQLSLDEKVFITGKANSRYSTANDEKTVHFDVNLGWKKIALLSSITQSDFGDLRMGTDGPDEYLNKYYIQRADSTDNIITNENPLIQKPSSYSQTNIMQKVRFTPNDKWDFQYGYHYSITSDYSRYDRLISYKNGLPKYAEWYYGPQKWIMNNFTVTNSSKNFFYNQVAIRFANQIFEESRISRNLNKSTREKRLEKVDATSVNIDFLKEIGSKNEFYYGVEVVTNDIESKGIDEDISTGTSSVGPSRYPNSTWESFAFYLSDKHKISKSVSVHGGIRYNKYVIDALFDTTFYPFPFTKTNIESDAVTGNIGIVIHKDEKWSIYSNLSTGFRSPNIDDMGKVFDSEPGSVVIPNPNLNSEYAYNGELGFVKIFGNILKLDVACYYTYLEDALVRRDYTLNGKDSIMYSGEMSKVQSIINAASAYVYGVQSEVEVKLSSELKFSSIFNYQKGEEEIADGTKSPSRHAAPWYGTSSLKFHHERLNINFYLNYCGIKKYEDLPEEEKGKPEIYAKNKQGNPYCPGWYTLNFKAMYKLTDNLSINAGLENITDQRYRPYSSGIVAAGRNFILSAKAVF